MMIRLLFFILSLTLSSTSFLKAEPAMNLTQIEPEFNGVSISITDNILHVLGATGQTLQIYNVAGICVQNFKVDGSDKRYELALPKGFYIVKVGKTVRKIALK